jgi:hypothetical protein
MAKSVTFLEKTALPDDFSTTFGNPGINIFRVEDLLNSPGKETDR